VTPQICPTQLSVQRRRRRRRRRRRGRRRGRREHPMSSCPKGEEKTKLQWLKCGTRTPHPKQRCPERRKRRRMSRKVTRPEWWDSYQARSR
jgi:hypothetical protein